MGLLNDQDQAAVRKEFEKISGPVKLVVFSQSLEAAELCRQNEELVQEVAALAPSLISVEVLNPTIDRDRAAAYGIDRVPAIVVEGARDYGIRFLGIPAGYEFANLIDSIIVASSGNAGLTAETQQALAGLTESVHIKVFSTPG